MSRIAPEQWRDFCAEFSRQHHGWLVTVTIAEPAVEPKPRIVWRDRWLQRVELEMENGGEPVLAIIAAADEDGGDPICYRIERPASVASAESGAGEHRGLDVVGEDGWRTELRFRSPTRPEALDGLAASEK